MAVMWPRELPPDVVAHSSRSAECKVYRRLEKVLEDQFVVFYSRPWLGLRPDGEEIDGECDFVIAHPELGLLTIEVKGGRIAYNPLKEEWTTLDRYDITSFIKNPVEQAMKSKHFLLGKLNKSPFWTPRFIRARHGIIFPDSVETTMDLGADKPREIFCFLDDFEGDFRSWIVGRFGEPAESGSGAEPLGDDGIEALEDLLAHPFTLHVPMGKMIDEDEKQIHFLTQQQFMILRAIEDIPRAAISGGAGTGKTVLAMEEARRCAAAGMQVLYTCFNKPLGKDIRRRLGSCDKIKVATFHELCFMAVKKAGIHISATCPPEELYETVYPESFLKALDLLPDLLFDAIIVDEGQDFLPLWWTCLDKILVDSGNGKVRVFYDSNQRLYYNSEKRITGFQTVPIKLSENIRNTRRIHLAAQHYYNGFSIQSRGPEGKKIIWIHADTPSDSRREVNATAFQLLSEERVRPEDITVLAGSENTLNELSPSGFIADKVCVNCENPAKDAIVLDTIRRFKGLENKIVILVLTRDDIKDKGLLYVALSRARAHLVIIGDITGMQKEIMEKAGEDR
jgi:hypothetical protein